MEVRKDGLTIVTVNHMPTSAWWSAWIDGDEEGLHGEGRTENEAIQDLREQILEAAGVDAWA